MSELPIDSDIDAILREASESYPGDAPYNIGEDGHKDESDILREAVDYINKNAEKIHTLDQVGMNTRELLLTSITSQNKTTKYIFELEEFMQNEYNEYKKSLETIDGDLSKMQRNNKILVVVLAINVLAQIAILFV
jgi:hypothetical protein